MKWSGALLVSAWMVLAACGNDSGNSRPGSGGVAGGGSGGAAGTATGGAAGGTGGSADSRCHAVNPEPGLMQSGSMLTEAELAPTFQALSSFLDTRTRDPNPQTDAMNVRTFVQTAPNVFDSGIGPDCAVWMRLTDGTSVTIFKDREGFGPDDPDPLEAAPAAPPPPPASPPLAPPPPPPQPASERKTLMDMAFTAYALPESETAFIGQADKLAVHALPKVELALKQRGYQVKASQSLTLAELRTAVKNLGVLWLSTHGATCINGATQHVSYCLTTDDPIDKYTGACIGTPADCGLTMLDRQSGRTGYSLYDANDMAKRRVFYTINDRFVSDHWSFAKNSLAFLDACESMDVMLTHPDPDASTQNGIWGALFRAAMVAKKVGTIVGWHQQSSAGYAARTAAFFFDRMLGANVYQLLNPPQRPFAAREVLAAMVKKGLHKDPNGAAELRIEQYATEDSILAPSIRNMVIGDPSNPTAAGEKKTDTELTLFGEFGTRALAVKVGGAAATVVTGKSDSKKLVVTLPGSASSGQVEIEVATGASKLIGNAAPLTSWKGNCRFKVTYSSFGSPGHFNELNCSSLHLRADVHGFRLVPEETALPGTAGDSPVLETHVDMRNSVSDTVCTGSIGGSWTMAGISNVVETKTNIPISWIENVTSAYPAKPNPWFMMTAAIDTADPAALKIKFPAANLLYADLTVQYPPPIGPTLVEDFSSSMASFYFLDQSVPLTPAFMVVQPKKEFPVLNGDKAEFECNLAPEANTIPTSKTPG